MDMELEGLLRPPAFQMAPYPAKVITLATGKKLVVRQVEREDVPTLLQGVKPAIDIPRDYYDIVAARLYAELLGWYRYRVRDHYCLAGQIDGILVGIVNGRMVNQDIGMSYHTLAIERGLRIGAHLFAAKMEHHLEYLGQKEVWITAESPIGFRRWMIEYGLELNHTEQHELGGATFYILTREIWENVKWRLCVGDRPAPQPLMDVAQKEIKIASERMIIEQILGAKRRQLK
ncbi:MAG: hypothetical protein JW953_00580 [Anaerolineae bacterium]|nr:hypothetical protein [Anaerolineae bacterium]